MEPYREVLPKKKELAGLSYSKQMNKSNLLGSQTTLVTLVHLWFTKNYTGGGMHL